MDTVDARLFEKVMSAFQQAVAVPDSERSALLDRLCEGDTVFRNEVEAMLRHDGAPRAFGRVREIGGGMRVLADEIARLKGDRARMAEEPAPASIGAYRVLRKIGEGGMGVVYEAEQSTPRRTVAIKVMRPGLRSDDFLRRFEHEAHILGRLQHPGIAQVFEAGTDESNGSRRMFLAMELVRGVPLTDYAKSRNLGVTDRLELLARICDAVQHAHQKGVIHRDLKPANILVGDDRISSRTDRTDRACDTVPDDTPRASLIAYPKVLDFGVARVMDPEAPFTTIGTGMGHLVGTLPYMSPEQVAGDPSAIDTRTDVYALGVLLYELLTDRLPYDVRHRSLPDAARMIRDELPTRLSAVSRVFRGDIETIVAKALEKDKSRRYQSAADLGSDIRRYLAGEPIDAKRDSAMYLLRRQLRRHRGALAAAMLFVVVLIGFGIHSAIQSTRNRELAAEERLLRIEADIARERALRERHRANAVSDQLAIELSANQIERGRLLGLGGNISQAEELLWSAFLRDPLAPHSHWALWELHSRHPCLAQWRGHDGDVLCAAYAPDGSWVASGASDGTVHVWDATAWLRRGSLIGHVGPVLAIAIDRNGNLIATASRDATVRLWDSKTLECVETLAFPAGMYTVSFSPDGSRLVTGGRDGVVQVRTMPDLRLERSHITNCGIVARAAIMADNTTLAISGSTGIVSILRADAGAWVDIPSHEREAEALTVSHDGRTLYTGSVDRRIRVFDIPTATSIGTLNASNGTVRGLDISPDGRWLASGGWWRVDLWDLTRAERRRGFSTASWIWSLQYHPDGTNIFSTCRHGMIRVWDTTAGALLTMPGHSERTAASFNSEGTMLVSGDSLGTIRTWDATTGRLIREFPGGHGRIRSIGFHPLRPHVVAGCDDNSLIEYDTASGKPVRGYEQHHDFTASAFAFSPDGAWLASCGENGIIRVFDSRTGECLVWLTDNGESLGVAFSPDGSRLAAVCRPGRVRAWSTWDWSELFDRSTGSVQPWTLDYNHDGTLLAVGDWSRAVTVCDGLTGEPLTQLTGHGGLVTHVRFRPGDPSLLASSDGDGIVRLWDVSAAQSVLRLDPFDGWDANCVGFSNDGGRLFSASANGSLLTWDLGYYNRHIDGSLDYHVNRLRTVLGDQIDDAALAQWRIRHAPGPARAPIGWGAQTHEQPVPGENGLQVTK